MFVGVTDEFIEKYPDYLNMKGKFNIKFIII